LKLLDQEMQNQLWMEWVWNLHLKSRLQTSLIFDHRKQKNDGKQKIRYLNFT
jgi:hypothetical protein